MELYLQCQYIFMVKFSIKHGEEIHLLVCKIVRIMVKKRSTGEQSCFVFGDTRFEIPDSYRLT
jgi:hypothetical protein